MIDQLGQRCLAQRATLMFSLGASENLSIIGNSGSLLAGYLKTGGGTGDWRKKDFTAKVLRTLETYAYFCVYHRLSFSGGTARWQLHLLLDLCSGTAVMELQN